MKMLARIALALTVTTATIAKAEFVDGDRLIIVDADTIALPCATVFRGCSEKLRITKVDAPETYRPRCPEELVSGLAAKQAAAEFLRGHRVEVVRTGKIDRYHRTLADLHVDGVDLGDHLLGLGLAIPYRPGRVAWLERAKFWCPNFVEGGE